MKDCKFCDKTGLLILPLRYAVVVDDKAPSLVPALPGTLGKGVSDLALTYGVYAPRLMRQGYLYVLIRRNIEGHGLVTYWEGYAITEDAYLYKFDIERPPTAPVTFTCDGSTCGIDASCVAIKEVEDVQRVYFLFTPSAMTPSKLDEYKKNADMFVGGGKMQAFDPRGWAKAGSRAQAHSLTPDKLGQHVVEWLLYAQCANALDSDLGKVMSRQLFPASTAAYAGVPAPALDQPPPGRLGVLQFKLERLKGAAYVVHDHIGITQELNDFRNSALEGVEHYLAATDQYGASNQQRLQVYEQIQEVKSGMLAGVVQTDVALIDQHRQGSDRWLERQRGIVRELRARGRESDALSAEAAIADSIATRDRNYASYIAAGKAKAQATWASKYESRLDTIEMERFYVTLKAHIANASDTVEARAAQHLRWFESDRLVSAFDTFDPTDSRSGLSFAVHAALCTYGIAGCKAAEDKLDAWIKAPSVERRNLYMRGVYYNQDDLIAAAILANAEITSAVASVDHASAIGPAMVLRAVKGLVDGFKKIDSAFDEWVRNQGQDFSRKWSKGYEVVLYHKASDMTRAVFRTGLGGTFDKIVTARISGLLYARLGGVTASIAFDEILLTIPKEKIATHQRERTERRAEQRRTDKASTKATKVASQVEGSLEVLIADAQAKANKKLTLGQLQGNASPSTNNYHQTRLGVVLGCIEMIALGEKLTHFDNDTKGWLEVGGSVMAVGSIVLDTYYSAAKAIREIEPYKSVNAINKGADIVRGGFKLGAGVLGMGAGLCGAYLDYQKLKTTDDKTLKMIYGARSFTGFVSAGLTILAAYSYTGPLLAHAAKGYAKHSLRYRALSAFGDVASVLAKRVRLLVWVARWSWAGLALTVFEIGYLYFKDNELQDWCDKCVFRKDKTYKNWAGREVKADHFDGASREIEMLERAAQIVGVGG